MAKTTIDRLIINSPYEEPGLYWSYDRESRLFDLKEGRRPAGYVIASESSKAFDDPGIFIEIPLVNEIRRRVKAWREHPAHPYAGVTGITRRLLDHWNNPEERESHRRLFFCQLEAMETLIWLLEAPEAEKVGVDIPSDGGLFERLCSKMATGSGKTIVMAMLIAWQVLNKVTYPQDARFSKNIFVVAPGLTVKNRLQVLYPFAQPNYYEEFNIVPSGLKEKLRQGKVLVRNWHTLHWETEEKIAKKKSVDKRGAKSNEAYVRIYNDPEVKDDVNRKAQEFEPLPDLVVNGYSLLGKDWLATKESWEQAGFKTPPVMISVANRTETAARIKYSFDHHKIQIEELCAPEKTLHIDSKVLEMAESQEEPQNAPAPEEESQEEEIVRKLSKKEQAELLRQTVDTVGQIGKPGEQIQSGMFMTRCSHPGKGIKNICWSRYFVSSRNF